MANERAKRLNVIVIMTDDQGCWAMGCAGNKEIRTPNLDRLAATGTRMENLFCVSPVCSPARASFLTGRIPSQHGIHDWLRAGNHTNEPPHGRAIRYLDGLTAYSEVLAANGYTCGFSGKWHLGDSASPQKGFTFWRVHAGGGGPYYNAPMFADGKPYTEPRYISDAFTDNALEFLRSQLDTRSPFYLSLNFTAPHSPWSRDHHPHDLYDGYLNNCAFTSIPVEPMHPWQSATAPYGDEKKRREILAGYFAAVTAMDACVGRVLDYLEAHGLRENTLVVFTGDNGMNMGHHGIFGKGNGTFPLNMYDTSVKVPFLVSLPGRVPAGVVRAELLSHYDFMPTLLDYLGLPAPSEGPMPGTSFAPLLRGEAMPAREKVVVFDEYGPVRMIRTREFKYVHRYPYGPHEFYDLVNDPGETTNLIDSAAHTPRIRELKGELENWFHRYVDPARDGVREPANGKGQLDIVGPASQGRENFAMDWEYLVPGKTRKDFPTFLK